MPDNSEQRAGRGHDGQTVLLIDDDEILLRLFRRCLDDAGYRVLTARSAAEAESALLRAPVDICVLDIDLGETSGLELLPRLREAMHGMRVIMATATDDVAVALNAVRIGASDYLVKPCSPGQLTHAVGRQAEARWLERRVDALEVEGRKHERPDLSTASPALRNALDLARRVADTDASVLILGENGTGKTMLARAIHDWSPRRQAAFATVSCPSLSAELLASELFGHVRGAFTGATDNRPGRVQIAEGGTLFLDEIGDLPLSLQPKLLRFLQDREYERVGDPRTRTANVRLVAATNQDLSRMVADRSFREDLFYRLNVVSISLPALRDRREDIVPIAQTLTAQLARRYDRPARLLSDAASAVLTAHAWPGNLRELRNAIERAVIICDGDTVRPQDLPFGPSMTPHPELRPGAPISLEELERAHVEAVVAMSSSLEAAAKLLGIDSSTLYRKRKQYQSK